MRSPAHAHARSHSRAHARARALATLLLLAPEFWLAACTTSTHTTIYDTPPAPAPASASAPAPAPAPPSALASVHKPTYAEILSATSEAMRPSASAPTETTPPATPTRALASASETAPASNPAASPAPDPVADAQSKLAAAPEKDRALWQYRLAATALHHDRPDIAKPALDDALATAAANYGNPNPAAAKSRSLIKKESDKPFIGEPHERVMANYYRALLYWADDEPDNARALLRTAQLLDSDNAKKTHANDYILLDYLDGLITAKLTQNTTTTTGGTTSVSSAPAAASLARARANAAAQDRPPLPDYDPAANVLIFVDYGEGPLKQPYGSNNDKFIYTLPAYPCSLAKLEINHRTIDLPPYDDIGYQALTRGGRVMDTVLAKKTSLSHKTLAAAILLGDPLVLGTLSRIIAKNAEADTRCWDNLPRYLSFVALKLPPGRHEAELSFYDPLGRIYITLTQHITIDVPADTTKDVVIMRSQLSN